MEPRPVVSLRSRNGVPGSFQPPPRVRPVSDGTGDSGWSPYRQRWGEARQCRPPCTHLESPVKWALGPTATWLPPRLQNGHRVWPEATIDLLTAINSATSGRVATLQPHRRQQRHLWSFAVTTISSVKHSFFSEYIYLVNSNHGTPRHLTTLDFDESLQCAH